MEEVSGENVTVEDVKVEKASEQVNLEAVLALGKHLDLVSELQFKKQVKLVAELDDENIKKFLLQLAKVNEKVEDKISDLKEELEDYNNGYCDSDYEW